MNINFRSGANVSSQDVPVAGDGNPANVPLQPSPVSYQGPVT